jgi:hypothetical protein
LRHIASRRGGGLNQLIEKEIILGYKHGYAKERPLVEVADYLRLLGALKGTGHIVFIHNINLDRCYEGRSATIVRNLFPNLPLELSRY